MNNVLICNMLQIGIEFGNNNLLKKVQKNLFICHIKCDDKNSLINIEPIWLPVHDTAVISGLQWLINDNEVEAQSDGWDHPSMIKTFLLIATLNTHKE